MAQTVNCSNCSAPLSLDPSRPTLHCDYCKCDVVNPAHVSPAHVSPVTAAGRTGLVIGIAAAILILGGALAVVLVAGGDKQPAAGAPGQQPAGKTTTREPGPAGPRVEQFLAAEDVTGDGIADLAFGAQCDAGAGGLYACGLGLLDGKDGKLAWHKTYLTTTAARGARTACHGVLVAQDNTRSIVAYEGQSGAERWRLTLSDFIDYQGMPAGTKERPVCLFATKDRALSVVDVKAGKLLWRREGMSPWGMREVEAGADTVLLKDAALALDLYGGAPRETGLKSSSTLPPMLRPRLALAGTHAYLWPARGSEVLVHQARDWKTLSKVTLPRSSRLAMYPAGDRVLLLNAFSPPTQIGLLDGARLTGPVTVSEDEGISQARVAGGHILLLTVSTKGTQRTTLRAFGLGLKGELWNAQLDASGKSFKFVTRGPNFGGFSSHSSGAGALVAAAQDTVLLEMAPANQQARLSIRDLRSGKVLGEVTLPAHGRGGDSTSLSWIYAGSGRVFARLGGGVVALDPAARKVVWSHATP